MKVFFLSAASLLWRIIRFLASLQVAVVLLGLSAAVLALATILEWQWGAEVAHFAIYRAWWFFLLILLLACSVLFSAVVRFPWKWHHTGFLVTHFGILLILAGALISLWYGIDAQLPVFEGQSAHTAFTNESEFLLSMYSWSDRVAGEGGDGEWSNKRPGDAVWNRPASGQSRSVPFRPGPFHWRDYARWPISLLGFLPRSQGLLFERDNIRLEVLDYLRNAAVVEGEPLLLSWRRPGRAWEPLECRVRGVPDPHARGRFFGLGARHELETGHRIVFWVAASRAETEAFLRTLPSQPLTETGELVLFHRNHLLRLPLEILRERRMADFPEAFLQVKFQQFNPQFLGLVLDLEPWGRSPEPQGDFSGFSHRLVLFGDMVEFNRYDEVLGVYGSFWYYAPLDVGGAGSGESAAGTGETQALSNPSAGGRGSSLKALKPRVDIIQGVDGILYYRTWTEGMVTDSGILPADGTPIRLFAARPAEIEIRVEKFTPMDRPGENVRPLEVQRAHQGMRRSFARVRLTVDGNKEEFWVEERPASPFFGEDTNMGQRRWVSGQGRSIAVELVPRTLDLGFVVKLHEFERKLEPGSTHPASYGSRVDVRDRDDPDRFLFRNVWITMNRPLTVTDPKTGLAYRIFQEAYRGPFRPGEPLFEHVIQGREPRQQLYLSWLTLNYDPGRGLKYFGSFLTVIGIAITFYMRGYFRSLAWHGRA